LLVGATTEERDFDPTPTAGGVYGLLEGAWRALPGIEELPLLEITVGFRPGSRDDAPMIGPTALEGLIIATGHHRNGILLAPVTVEAIDHYLSTGAMMPELRSFSPSRFQEKKP
jgi:glycine oxidase